MNDQNDINDNYALINNPLENENNNNENVIIDNNNQDQNNPDINELQDQLMINNISFFDKFSSQEIFEILNNLVPPSLFSLLIYYSFNSNGVYCDMNVYFILKTLLCVYLGYIIYSLYHSFLIYKNKSDKKALKISLILLNALITTFYFFSIFISYLIFLKNDSVCFVQDNFITIVFYALLFIGVVNIMQKVINLGLIIASFSLLVNTFLTNPSHFYSEYGIDPEIIRNLPTITADEKHVSCCVICTEDIKKGDEIMILKCPGNHFFHASCIKSWLIVKTICPMCRSENVL
jgi:hypothetical protein